MVKDTSLTEALQLANLPLQEGDESSIPSIKSQHMTKPQMWKYEYAEAKPTLIPDATTPSQKSELVVGQEIYETSLLVPWLKIWPAEDFLPE